MPRPHITPGKYPVPIVQENGCASGPVWSGTENLAPTGIRSPDRPARRQSLYRLRFPAHYINIQTYIYIYIYIYNFNMFSVLRMVRCHFQSELCTEGNIVLPHSICSILSFPYGHPLAAYVFFLVFLSLLSFSLSFLQ